ncbi:MAG: hypothetical protein KC420_02635 [Myxococcales bacterium]|nr:hypothetical protein [Myxococcales bacterium]MCB9567490.1 hypothetical protein [Myxococcales bacterium]MCB9700639.1 hypothetical protein [Myxococcales bacterium]
MTQELTTITITKAFAEFMAAKGETLTRRALRNYSEVLDLLVEFLDDKGISSVELVAPRRGGATIEQMLGFIDDFNDDYLVNTVKAERDFLRNAGQVSRDLGRWLKNLSARHKKGAEASTASAHA